MTTFSIANTTSGLNLGDFDGLNAVDAYRSMLDDAGELENCIGKLRDEAGEAGDDLQVALCRFALNESLSDDDKATLADADIDILLDRSHAEWMCCRAILDGQGDIVVTENR